MRRTLLLPLVLIPALAVALGSALALGPASTPGPRISAVVIETTTTTVPSPACPVEGAGDCRTCPEVPNPYDACLEDDPAPPPTLDPGPPGQPNGVNCLVTPDHEACPRGDDREQVEEVEPGRWCVIGDPRCVKPAAPTWDPSLQPCDGLYPPCSVAWNESRGDYSVVSPDGLYYGKWQFLRSTWDNAARMAGRADLVGVQPNLASPADQDLLARVLWDEGRGCSHWGACR